MNQYHSSRNCSVLSEQTQIPDWSARIPTGWAERIVTPAHFEYWREDIEDLSATRTLGYDSEGKRSYCRLTHLRYRWCSDDDELFYAEPGAHEVVEAWRLKNNRWLIRRERSDHSSCSEDSADFSVAANCPK